MWPFRRTKQPLDVGDRLDALEVRMKRLEEDWTDTYAKFRLLHMRVAKQVQRLDQAPERGDTQPVEGSEPQTVSIESGMTPRQLEVQRNILRRRNRGGGGD